LLKRWTILLFFSIVKVHQKVNATVISVDPERKRISLSLKKDPLRQNNKTPRKEKKKDSKKLYLKKTVPSEKKVKKPGRPFNNPFVDMFN